MRAGYPPELLKRKDNKQLMGAVGGTQAGCRYITVGWWQVVGMRGCGGLFFDHPRPDAQIQGTPQILANVALLVGVC